MTGQLYEIEMHNSAAYPANRDPAGELVHDDDGDPLGLILRYNRCTKMLLILLFRSRQLPKGAKRILQYCNWRHVLEQEVAVSPVLRKRIVRLRIG